jgi:cytochrome c-type protein NapC
MAKESSDKSTTGKNGKGDGFLKWRVLFRPSVRFSIATLIVAGVVIGVVGYFTSQTVLHATSTDDFCMTCHSNHSLRDEVLASAHGNNSAGMVVQCKQCHLPNERLAYLFRKIYVSKDLIGFMLTPDFNTQEWLDENRREQADLALKWFRKTDSKTCQYCHSRIYEDPPEAMGRMAIGMHRMNHNRAPEERQTCVDCHKGETHPYPDYPED